MVSIRCEFPSAIAANYPGSVDIGDHRLAIESNLMTRTTRATTNVPTSGSGQTKAGDPVYRSDAVGGT